ncbi:hypothetical protein K7432_006130 [Basidiobolus ranarum]|uniref:F-box domain-containing protein n=1 Tax=Basidiobolus ranarum TaxID=34480 RepID=A0ABR2W228_9FUNG
MSPLLVSTEITTLIISYLEYEKHTLHSLLTVNKMCFNAAIPILYKNPFRSCFWKDTSEGRKREVLYLLLASSCLLSKLTKFTTKLSDWASTEWDLPTAPFTVNYLNYYTEINYSEWARINNEQYSYVTRNFNFRVDQTISFLFCEHNVKKLKCVCLPILDMKPYLSLASRMPYLQRLEYCRLHKDQTTATYNQDILAIQDATEFVKIHVETFGDTLTEIKIPELSDLKCDGNQLGKQIWDIIKLLKRPSVIEVDDSYDFCQYIQGPIVDHLRVFRGSLMRDRGEIPYWDSASLFRRCTKLEKVSFCPSGLDSFKWAVKKRALLLNSDCSVTSTSEVKLPPLQEVYMVCKNFAALRIVEDIIYAFRNTIRKITVVDKHYVFSPTPLSWDWLLPNLVKIHMIIVDLTLFDLESLNLCPSLEELCITTRCRRDDTVAEFGPILRLPNLRSLTLLNRISHEFNFGSLEYSPLLETIMLWDTSASLPTRPSDSPCWTWTWDWKLPHLKELKLNGESAALFQFRLLDSCPLLEKIFLDTIEYHRTLSLNEMLGTNLSSEGMLKIVPRNEISRKCKEFYLTGYEISGETLFALLQRYLADVTEIHLLELDGLTSTDVINATQKLPHIRYVHSTLTLTDADIQQNEMYLLECRKHGKVWRCGSVNYIMRNSPNQARVRVIK